MSRKQPPGSGSFDRRRRRILKGLAAAAGSAALPGYLPNAEAVQSLPPLPDPEHCGIDHIVVVMMENRSFDHFLGWVPGADGGQNRKYPDKNGVLQSTFALAADPQYGYQGCGKEDPNHGYSGGRKHYNNGRMDGFLQTVSSPNDLFPLGYYTAGDVPFFKGVADNYTIGDRYFSGILSSTFPNRMYIHSGQTDRNTNTLPYVQQAPSTLPSIWGLLQAKGVGCRYYFNDLPFLGLWGPTFMPISKPYEKFLVDAAAGNLPHFSFVDPFFGASGGESPYGVARDDHPQSDIRDGQAFLDQIYNAVRSGPRWDSTLLIITYDEWGGFFDHVAPPMAPVSDAERTVVGNDGRLGFRVPLAIIGPRARRKHVTHLQFDPNSILNFVRWRFGLGALSARDSTSLNLAYALDFDSAPKLSAPKFAVPHRPSGFGRECSTGLHFPLPNLVSYEFLDTILDPVARAQAEHLAELQSLRRLAIRSGWQI
ncbi:MAG TPA: alkaline phosphatase family protein [Nevskiaceae bacterium]|nr:alkaline phosphatase family protein [Nevskiaceae bacterium]